MTHATVYLPGHSEWNESLATVVGNEGAAQFFAARGDSRRRRELIDESRQRERRRRGVLALLGAGGERRSQSLYAETALSRDAKIKKREQIFADARAASS